VVAGGCFILLSGATTYRAITDPDCKMVLEEWKSGAPGASFGRVASTIAGMKPGGRQMLEPKAAEIATPEPALEPEPEPAPMVAPVMVVEPEPEPVAVEEQSIPPVQVTPAVSVDPMLMSEEERVALAASLVASIPNVSVAKIPEAAKTLPEIAKARELATPVALPKNYAYLGAVEKAKVLENALEAMQKRNSELLTELEHRTQWEAVRLSTALRERAAEEGERAKALIETAQLAQHEHFLTVLKRKAQEFEGELSLKVAHAKAEAAALKDQQMSAQLDELEQERKASEQQLVESVEANITQRNAAEAGKRTEEIVNMQLQLQALSQVVADDANFKNTSQQVHRVSQAVLAISTRLENNAPFAAEMKELREVGVEDEVIRSALSYIPPSAPKRGVSTYAQLQDKFAKIAPSTRRAALMPDDGGPLWIPLSYFFDAIKFQPSGNVPGNSCEEILARVEHSLNSGELETAVQEATLLSGNAEKVMMAWRGEAMDRLRVDQAINVIKAHGRCLVAQVTD